MVVNQLDCFAMHLKSLTLKGFKSFASATTMKFEPGICAVVGPNGSGKSNVVDALAWVMGEQGAKTLRGGKMDDVIFAGAGDRKPLGRAEVTLTIDNTDGALPIDYTEVSITRRMFRDGASEYEINGAKARLMDIQELLSDSGIGREMHVIVGQGRLAQILESRPEERRAFIEEAAGVLKHRRRKEKAQRKLQGMQANLDRLTDLHDELSKQLKPLARQAEAAQRASEVQAKLREGRLLLAADKVTSLMRTRKAAVADSEAADREVEVCVQQLTECTELYNRVEAEFETLEPEVDKAQHLWFNLSSLSEKVAATLRIANDRATNAGGPVAYQGPDLKELISRAERAEQEELASQVALEEAQLKVETIAELVANAQEVSEAADREHLAEVRAIADRKAGIVRLIAAEESARAQVEQATETKESAEAEMEEIYASVEELGAQVTATREEVEQLALAQEPVRQRLQEATKDNEAANARLEQLRKDQHERERAMSRLEARIETLRENLPVTSRTAEQQLGKLKAVAELLGVERGMDVAVARALDSMAGGVLFSAKAIEPREISELAASLAEAERTTVFFPNNSAEQWRLSIDLPAGCSWLLDHMRPSAELQEAMNRLLADVIVAPSLESAWLAVRDEPRLRAVTEQGELCGDGWISLGKKQATAVELAGDIAAAEAELEKAREKVAELTGQLAGAAEAAEAARVTLADVTAAQRGAAAEEAAVRSKLAEHTKQHDQAVQRYERARARFVQAGEKLGELDRQLADVLARLARVDEEGTDEEPDTADRDRAAAELAQAKSMELEARLALGAAEERANSNRGRAAALRRQIEHERAQRARHEATVAAARQKQELARTISELANEVAERVDLEIEMATRRRDELTSYRAALTERRAAAKAQVDARREKLARAHEGSHTKEIVARAAQAREEQYAQQVREQLSMSVNQLMLQVEVPLDFDRWETENEIEQAEKDLRALGKVNPLALEEYKALEERFNFLSTQLADVQQARKDLMQVIMDVDDKILQLFTDAWHDVERAFPQVFSTLFPGGEGRLILTDPDDMLTTGIEVEARPPGKRVKRLSLLSGGEKSLTALAMLVAIFQARPSPFYVMDEVEAALDDTNLRRLIALFEKLRETSQLIVITHQKPTMDVANVLYGVTMRGDGVTRVISQRMTPAVSSSTNTGTPTGTTTDAGDDAGNSAGTDTDTD